jgi:hypothetical protein
MHKKIKGFVSAFSGLCLISAFSPSTLQAADNERCIAGAGSWERTKPANLYVKNASDNAVQMTWIDFKGKRKKYQVIEPGGYVNQPSYEWHKWVIEDVRPPHACKVVIMVGESNVKVKILN